MIVDIKTDVKVLKNAIKLLNKKYKRLSLTLYNAPNNTNEINYSNCRLGGSKNEIQFLINYINCKGYDVDLKIVQEAA
jgi:hypothetical protein